MMWGWGWWGMSWFWWLFWALAILAFFTLLTPVPRGRARQARESPLDILERRYAEGQMSTPEFEERRERLLANRSPTVVQPGRPIPPPPRPTEPPAEHPPH